MADSLAEGGNTRPEADSSLVAVAGSMAVGPGGNRARERARAEDWLLGRLAEGRRGERRAELFVMLVSGPGDGFWVG